MADRPAAASAASKWWVDVAKKNSSAVRYSKLAELDTSTTADAAVERRAEPFARDGVDAEPRRRRYGLVAVFSEPGYDLRADEARCRR